THSGPEAYSNGITTNALTDSGLTPGNCVQASGGGLLITIVGACGTSSGTLTATGAPASGQGTFWSGGTSVTGSPNWLYSATTGHTLIQGANGNETVFASRFTDTSPTGNFLHFQNAAKNADLWLIDVSGTLQAGILPYARLSSFPAGCGANLFVTAIGSSLTCAQPAFSNLSGTASDTQLANAYSGVGSCSANNWITALSRNASPSCAQPAFSNLSGLIAIGQTVLTTRGDILTVNSTPAMARLGLGSSNLYPKSNGSDLVYSNLAAGGVGSCSSNNWVNALNADAAPTCAQPAFSNLSGQATTGQITPGSNGQRLTPA